ncbi:hypothetical protein [Ligilactobacillus aviarius]|uniref:hypothetical protein n=1 Tax=Ligilactobacillus aviarius TaxID=1606 RepID=UPI0024BBE233|nr:hypothetical protein [Ligilactobacillus aviarius]
MIFLENLISFFIYPIWGIIIPSLIAIYYWKITLNTLFVSSTFFWLLWAYFKGKDDRDKKFTKLGFYFGLFPTTLISVVTGVWDIYHVYESMGVKACAELTGVTATVLTIIATIFGYFYNKSQSKIQAIHAESKWRKRLLDLEKKPFYTTNDLLELNSFINPYHKKHGKDNLDIYINKVIVDCIHHLTKDDDSNNSNTIKKDNYEVENYLEKILFGDSEENKENDDTEKSTLWDVWPKNICPYCSLVLTNEIDTIKIRRCIHALLKDDWEKNVRQHTFYKE